MGFGTWDRLAGSDGSAGDYTDVLNNHTAPTEPNCKPLPVEILPGVLTEEGADFLCDFHLSMSLECQISEEGETKCYDEGDSNPTSADNIYCWVPPTEGTAPPVTNTTPEEATTPEATTPEATTPEDTPPAAGL